MDDEVRKSAIETIVAQLSPTGEMPMLKAFAAAMDIPYARMRTVAKQPEDGMVYDANSFNWFAVSRFITRRLDPENGFSSLEEVVQRAIELDTEIREQDGRRSASVGKQTITLSDGTQIPTRKFDFELGDTTTIRKDESGNVYEVVYLTISHIVIRLINDEKLYCMSNNTANLKLTKPVKPVDSNA